MAIVDSSSQSWLTAVETWHGLPMLMQASDDAQAAVAIDSTDPGCKVEMLMIPSRGVSAKELQSAYLKGLAVKGSVQASLTFFFYCTIKSL